MPITHESGRPAAPGVGPDAPRHRRDHEAGDHVAAALDGWLEQR